MTQASARVQIVTSADGASIAVHCVGEGPPLLLVHGALADHSYWDALAPLLSSERELMAVDRRGRGASGDASEYKYEREVDDLFAAVMGLHRDVDVLAHSSGAILALRAAERGLPVRRLILYEPPLVQFRSEAPMPEGFSARLDSLVAQGDRDGAVREFLRNGVSLSDEEVEGLRSSPRWGAVLALAHTVPYDARAAAEYVLEPRRLKAVRAPVLLLQGALSPAWMKRGVSALAAGLPDARIVELPGQGHNAVVTAPEVVAREARAFLGG